MDIKLHQLALEEGLTKTFSCSDPIYSPVNHKICCAMHSAASISTQAKKKDQRWRKKLVLYGHGKGTKRKAETVHKLSQKNYREITKKAKGDAPIALDDESGTDFNIIMSGKDTTNATTTSTSTSTTTMKKKKQCVMTSFFKN